MKKLLLFGAILLTNCASAQVTPILHYSFDNSTAEDEVGTQNGILNGTEPCEDRFGNIDRAFYFSNEAYIIHNGLSFGNLAESSVSVWVEPENSSLVGGFSSTMLSTGQWIMNFNRFNTPSVDGHFFGFMDGTSGDNNLSNWVGPVTAQTWVHLVMTNNGSTTSLYINGNLESTFPENFLFTDNAYDLYLGVRGYGNNAPNDYFDGKMDEFQIFGKALSQTEIDSLYNLPNPYLSITELKHPKKELIKIVNLLGQETEYKPNTVLIYIYSDGTSEKVFTIED